MLFKIRTYRHFKGGLYAALEHPIMNELGCEVVLYYSLEAKSWHTRPKDEFFGYTADGQMRFSYVEGQDRQLQIREIWDGNDEGLCAHGSREAPQDS